MWYRRRAQPKRRHTGDTGGRGWDRGRVETSVTRRVWRVMAKTQAFSWAQRGHQDTFLFLPSSSRNTERKLRSARHVKLNQILRKGCMA